MSDSADSQETPEEGVLSLVRAYFDREFAALSVERDELQSSNTALTAEAVQWREDRDKWRAAANHWHAAAAAKDAEIQRLKAELAGKSVQVNRLQGDCKGLQFHIDTLRAALESHVRHGDAIASQPRLQPMSADAIAALQAGPNPQIIVYRPHMVAMLFYMPEHGKWGYANRCFLDPLTFDWFIDQNTIPVPKDRQ